MAKRLDDNQSFINTVLNEANWTQANIEIKLNEGSKAQQEDEDSRKAGRGPGIVTTRDGKAIKASEVDDEDIKDSTEYTYAYAACPLCESELENDDVIFENIGNHFSNLIDLVEQVEAITESDDYDGNGIMIEATDDHTCPLCESQIEDDSVIIDNMNEHFDVVLEMLEEAADDSEDEDEDEDEEESN